MSGPPTPTRSTRRSPGGSAMPPASSSAASSAASTAPTARPTPWSSAATCGPPAPPSPKAFIDGALSTGADVIDIGLIDTPQTLLRHQPPGRLRRRAGRPPATTPPTTTASRSPAPRARRSARTAASRRSSAWPSPCPGTSPASAASGASVDLAGPYKDFVRKFLKPTRPMKVVVDASNGMAGKWFPMLFDDVPGLRLTEAELRPARQDRPLRPRAQPPGRGQPPPAPAGRAPEHARTSASASTATPTAASSSMRPARSCAATLLAALLAS